MIDAMAKPLPPYLLRETTRHGKTVYRVRRDHGLRIRLTAVFDTPEFWEQYRAALAGVAPPKVTQSGKTLRWGIDAYRGSGAWKAMSPATRKQRENIYLHVVEASGDALLSEIDQSTIRDGRERRAATPHSANNFLKAMRGLFGWLVEHEHVAADPTKGVALLAGKNDAVGFHTWTEDELARFEAHWPLGTRERLAFDLLLYTGLRRGDAVVAGRQHVRDSVLTLRMEKTGGELSVPVLPPLAASIAATKTGDLAFLVTEYGRPFVKEGFGNWFREVCHAAGCRGSAHGLRKAGATRAALNGATEAQLMAMFGWTDHKMAAHYTKAADRLRLAREAGKFMLGSPTPEVQIPLTLSRTRSKLLKGRG